MRTLRYPVRIDAPKPVVWRTMLGDTTFRDASSAFAPGSHDPMAGEET